MKKKGFTRTPTSTLLLRVFDKINQTYNYVKKLYFLPSFQRRNKNTMPRLVFGFTLIELLVVISIIGMLSSVVLSSLNSARSKSRDARRKMDLKQLTLAIEMYYDSNPALTYPVTGGWFANPNHGQLDSTVGLYIKIPDDPQYPSQNTFSYLYMRKDYNYTPPACLGTTVQGVSKYAFYARLENPSTSDLATLSDAYDQCISTNWGVNYRAGN